MITDSCDFIRFVTHDTYFFNIILMKVFANKLEYMYNIKILNKLTFSINYSILDNINATKIVLFQWFELSSTIIF